MILLQTGISGLYYALVGFVALLLIWNLVRSKKWEEEVLLVIVLVPFLLRLFGLK
jgi:uncharacterized membrane protein